MKIDDLTPGEIYTIPGTHPTYALVLDDTTTYSSPNKAKARGFVPTGTKKSHASAQGVLVVASKELGFVRFAQENLNISWCVEVATRWPETLDQLLMVCRRDVPHGNYSRRVALTVIASRKFVE